MNPLRLLIVCFLLVILTAACTTAPGKEKGRVLCPECGYEFDSLYEKRF